MHCKYRVVEKFSKKFFALVGMVLLIVYSPFSFAEWILYSPETKSGITSFYESNSLKSVDGYEAVVILKNFSKTQVVKYDGGKYIYKSKVTRQIIDCANNRYATASIDMYPKLYGLGKASPVFMKGLDWNPVKVDSVQEALIEKACKKV